MRSVFSAALWLQTLFIASNGIEASAKATQYSNIETRAQLYGSSHRVKRSVDTVQDIRLERILFVGKATFRARAALVALLSKMCWTCLSSTVTLPD